MKLQNRQEISLKTCSRGQPTCLKLLSDDSIALGFTTGEVVIFSLQNYKPQYGFNELNSPVCCLETIFTPNKYLICGGGKSDPTLIIWDFENSRGIRRLSGHKDLISSVIDISDGRHIMTGSFDSKIVIWEIEESFKSH